MISAPGYIAMVLIIPVRFCRPSRQIAFEKLAEQLANASTPEELLTAAKALVHGETASTATVLIARDTRPTGECSNPAPPLQLSCDRRFLVFGR